MNVQTRVGRDFLSLIDKHFPKGSPLSKFINRNTIKVSYRCGPNMGRYLARHNSKILNKNSGMNRAQVPKCNCQKSRKGSAPSLVNVTKWVLFTRPKLIFKICSKNSMWAWLRISSRGGGNTWTPINMRILMTIQSYQGSFGKKRDEGFMIQYSCNYSLLGAPRSKLLFVRFHLSHMFSQPDRVSGLWTLVKFVGF